MSTTPGTPDHELVDRFTAAFAEVVEGDAPAALVVRRGDRVLVDLASGHDRDGRAFTSDRPVFLYSAVKPVAALAALTAVAASELDLDQPVAATWPAFGAHGRDAVTVADALAHTAAVPGWRPAPTADQLLDRDRAIEALVDQASWWPVGEPGEHATSYGHVVDGILRHATGADVLAWADRATSATGTGLTLVPGAGARRPAPLEDPAGAWRDEHLAAEGPMGELLREPPELLDVDWVNGPGRDLVAPAVTGYGSAHDLAGLWAWWSGDGGASHLGVDLRDRSVRAHVDGHDHVLDRPVRWGLGPQLDVDGYGMGGVGGCVGWYEPARDLAIGFTTPRVTLSSRWDALDDAIDAVIDATS